MHNVNYEINATGKSRDLVDFFLFLWGRENPERGEDTFLLKIPIPTLPHGGGGGGGTAKHGTLPEFLYQSQFEVGD